MRASWSPSCCGATSASFQKKCGIFLTLSAHIEAVLFKLFLFCELTFIHICDKAATLRKKLSFSAQSLCLEIVAGGLLL